MDGNSDFRSVLNQALSDMAKPEPIDPDPDHLDVPYVIVASLVCALGLFGNLVAIFVIVVLKEYQKSVTHWYVLQLAVADTIFLLTWPFKLHAHVVDKWEFPEWMCKANETILFLNYYASVIFLVVMSVDRYIAVCQSFSPTLQQLRKRTSAFIVAMCVWGGALALTIPVMLHSFKVGFSPFCKCTYEFDKFAADQASSCQEKYNEGSRQYEGCLDMSISFRSVDNGLLYCRQFHGADIVENFSGIEIYEGFMFESNSGLGDYDETEDFRNPSCHYFNHPIGWKLFLYFNFVGMFVVPFFIMALAYGMIVYRLHTTRMRRPSIASSASFSHSTTSSGGSQKKRRKSSAQSDKDRRRVTIMCAALVISFMVCWIPFHSVHIAKFYGIKNQTSDYCEWLQRIGSVFVYLSAAINPYLYSFLGTHFLNRWKFATTTVRKSMRRRGSSTSGTGLGSVKYARKAPGRENSTSNNQTLMTKLSNRNDTNAVSESKPMTFTGTNYNSEMGQTKDQFSEGVLVGTSSTPPQDNENVGAMKDNKNEVFQD